MEIETSKNLAGVCGICCPTCILYIGTKEDSSKIEKLALKIGVKVEDLNCKGCRSDQKSLYCKSCKFVPCSVDKGIDFCIDCYEYPCKVLYDFQKEKPHRIELWEHNEFLKTNGMMKWFEEMAALHSCSNCGTINSAYDLQCRKCGSAPSCDFVALYGDRIFPHLKK